MAAGLECLIVSSAEKETFNYPSSIVELEGEGRLHTHLNMLPDAVQTSGIGEGLTVSSVSSSPMNATPVTKALLPGAHRR